MQPSRFVTYDNLPVAADTNATPRPIAKAAGVPLRVVVRNISGVVIILGADPASINSTERPETFQLDTSTTETFIIAPFQTLYAMGLLVSGGRVSVAISEAWPVS